MVNATGEPEHTVVGVALKSATGGATIPVPLMTKLYVPSSQSFVPKETVPVNGPATEGVKVSVNVVEPPAGTVVIPKEVPKAKVAPVTVIGGVNAKLVVPVF